MGAGLGGLGSLTAKVLNIGCDLSLCLGGAKDQFWQEAGNVSFKTQGKKKKTQGLSAFFISVPSKK